MAVAQQLEDYAAEPELDAEALLALARDKSSQGRAALLRQVGDLFGGTSRELTEGERSLMEDILVRLVNDVEQSVKAALADRLADVPQAPRGLILALANDEFRVAYPILKRSSLLQDPDLIEIIHHRTRQHMLSIAMRDEVSEAVSDELVERGDTSVVRTLLENTGAHISEPALEFLVEQSQTIGAYREPLVRREELPADLAARMYAVVSASLREYILVNFEIEAPVLDANLGPTAEQLMDEIRERSRLGQPRPVELAELLAHANALSPRFLIDLLREGEVALFEGLLAEMAGLPLKQIRRFIYEPGGQALAIACKSAGVAKADFASILLLSRQARPGDKSVDPQELPRALALFDRVKEKVALYVVQRWRMDPDYLYAIKRLETDEAADG
ncbi:MAG: DUF2336 domain-containing protein [Alphaproteobacteria bacterium]|nr:DUF2336 domain-containing protein [Alphaproteobacteria bacterium]